MKTVSDELLKDKVTELPLEISPRRDLWQGIERAIVETNQDIKTESKVENKSIYLVSLAASFALAAVLSWKMLLPVQDVVQPDISMVEVLQKDFDQQKQFLLTSYGKSDQVNLAPAMKTQLAELKSARESIKKALLADPNNVDLINLLRWTQKQELELLEHLYSPQWQSI